MYKESVKVFTLHPLLTACKPSIFVFISRRENSTPKTKIDCRALHGVIEGYKILTPFEKSSYIIYAYARAYMDIMDKIRRFCGFAVSPARKYDTPPTL